MDEHLRYLIRYLHPRTVCDIGPGAGKYSDLVREIAASEGFDTHLTGIEIDESYVKSYGLRDKYDALIIGDAIGLIEKPRTRFDLVIIGDCIEHMRKSNAIDLLNFLFYRTAFIFLVFPSDSVQDDWEGHAAEAHISVWNESDFVGFRHLSTRKGVMNLVVIRGLQHSLIEIDAISGDEPSLRRLAGARPGAFYNP